MWLVARRVHNGRSWACAASLRGAFLAFLGDVWRGPFCFIFIFCGGGAPLGLACSESDPSDGNSEGLRRAPRRWRVGAVGGRAQLQGPASRVQRAGGGAPADTPHTRDREAGGPERRTRPAVLQFCSKKNVTHVAKSQSQIPKPNANRIHSSSYFGPKNHSRHSPDPSVIVGAIYSPHGHATGW